jgi:DNA-binding MarR family transcriptional regulator
MVVNDLSEAEWSLIEALWRRGPALPVELAVRTLSLLSEISVPLASLEEKGLVERQALKTGEIFVLSKNGLEVARR